LHQGPRGCRVQTKVQPASTGQKMQAPSAVPRPRHVHSPFDDFDDHLDEARRAITASVASLRAAELQLDDIQHAQRPNAEHAVRLCEQAVALHDGILKRLVRMDLAADHVDDLRLPQRVNNGSPAPACRPPALSSAANSASSFNLRRNVSSFGEAAAFEVDTAPLQPAKPHAGRPEAFEEGPGTPSSRGVLDRVSAVLIDLDGTMYNPLGAIQGADEFYAYLVRRKIPYVFLSNTGAKDNQGTQVRARYSLLLHSVYLLCGCGWAA
jgi:hypothetical protein